MLNTRSAPYRVLISMEWYSQLKTEEHELLMDCQTRAFDSVLGNKHCPEMAICDECQNWKIEGSENQPKSWPKFTRAFDFVFISKHCTECPFVTWGPKWPKIRSSKNSRNLSRIFTRAPDFTFSGKHCLKRRLAMWGPKWPKFWRSIHTWSLCDSAGYEFLAISTSFKLVWQL